MKILKQTYNSSDSPNHPIKIIAAVSQRGRESDERVVGHAGPEGFVAHSGPLNQSAGYTGARGILILPHSPNHPRIIPRHRIWSLLHDSPTIQPCPTTAVQEEHVAILCPRARARPWRIHGHRDCCCRSGIAYRCDAGNPRRNLSVG